MFSIFYYKRVVKVKFARGEERWSKSLVEVTESLHLTENANFELSNFLSFGIGTSNFKVLYLCMINIRRSSTMPGKSGRSFHKRCSSCFYMHAPSHQLAAFNVSLLLNPQVPPFFNLIHQTLPIRLLTLLPLLHLLLTYQA